MTRLLLGALGHGTPLPTRRPSLLPLLVVAWLLPLALIADAVLALWRYLRVRAVVSRPVAWCPRQHAVELWGAWTCAACGLTAEGHGFAPCRYCQEVPIAVFCACGLPAVSPLSDGSGRAHL